MHIYLDHAATTRLDPVAFEAMKPFLMDEYGNASQLYSFARAPKKALKGARETIASCIGAEPEEIFFTSGGTESDNWALKGVALIDNKHRTTITTSFEHHAVLHAAETLEQLDHPVKYIWPDTTGTITPESLDAVITNGILLVSVMYANNEIGSIQPIKELCSVAHSHGALFHTDAVQAVGHIPINVKDLDVDLLSASAHKFNGPKGIGFLYIRKGTAISSYLDGGAQENGLRAGTENIASIVGMSTALKQNCEAMATRTEHIKDLEKLLMKRLHEYQLDFIRNGSENHIPGSVSLSFKKMEGEVLLHRLDLMNIFVSTGSACNSKSSELSHVIKAVHVPKDYAFGTIRISLGYENTAEEVETVAASLRRILTT